MPNQCVFHKPPAEFATQTFLRSLHQGPGKSRCTAIVFWSPNLSRVNQKGSGAAPWMVDQTIWVKRAKILTIHRCLPQNQSMQIQLLSDGRAPLNPFKNCISLLVESGLSKGCWNLYPHKKSLRKTCEVMLFFCHELCQLAGDFTCFVSACYQFQSLGQILWWRQVIK